MRRREPLKPSVLENQTCGRAVSESATILVGQATLGSANVAAARNDRPLSFHQTHVRGDGPNKQNLEFKCCLPKTLVEHGQDCEPHTGIEQRCSKTAMNSPKRVAVFPMGFGSDNDAAPGNVNDVIAEGFGHRVQRQGAVDKSLDEFETAHCSLLVFIDDSKMSFTNGLRHEFHRTLIGDNQSDWKCRIRVRREQSASCFEIPSAVRDGKGRLVSGHGTGRLISNVRIHGDTWRVSGACSTLEFRRWWLAPPSVN